MQHMLDIVAANSVPFRVLAIPASEEGPNPGRAPAGRGRAIVEFYDRRYDHDPGLGQFTGGYYELEALLGTSEWSDVRIGERAGLNLSGGSADWMLDLYTAALVARWLEALERSGALV
jgi:hypothetical protein